MIMMMIDGDVLTTVLCAQGQCSGTGSKDYLLAVLCGLCSVTESVLPGWPLPRCLGLGPGCSKYMR